MKLRTLLLASVAILTIACQKDDYYSGIEDSSKSRIITASFENSETKTTLAKDGTTPLWAVGDQIWISDGKNSATIEITISDISTDKRSFDFDLPAEITGEILYAVYPASCATGTVGENGIGITIPSRQDGTFASANICVAKTSEGKKDVLSFKNATAIIKVTENKTAHDYMFLEASAETAPAIAGSFTAAINDNTVSLNPTNAKSKIGGTLLTTGDNPISYYAIAPCQATSLTFKARSATEGKFASKTFPSNFTFNANTIYELAMPTTWDKGGYKERIIIGEFSVSATKKVQFSPGNLQAELNDDRTTVRKWQFAQNQYDYIGANNIVSENFGTTIDLFGWSTNSKYGINLSINNDQDYSGDFSDWGKNGDLINNLGSGWFTLSKEEWEYLLNTRKVNGNVGEFYSFLRADINCTDKTSDDGDYGMILFPDGYTGQSTNIRQSTNIKYKSSEWLTMESEGCVFLPCAGYRGGTSVNMPGSEGRYWSSTPYKHNTGSRERAYNLEFNKKDFEVKYNTRHHGRSLRLAREL